MYCPQCDVNWNYVPGKRYFRTEVSLPGTHQNSMLCPACAECPQEKQQRALKNEPREEQYGRVPMMTRSELKPRGGSDVNHCSKAHRQIMAERRRQLDACNPFKNPDGSELVDVESRIARIRSIKYIKQAEEALFYCSYKISIQSVVLNAAAQKLKQLQKWNQKRPISA